MLIRLAKNIGNKKLYSVFLMILTVPIFATGAHAQQNSVSVEVLYARCVSTPPVTASKYNCESGWDWIKAPRGHFVDTNSINPILETRNATCQFRAKKYVDVGSDERQPTQLGVRAFGNSSRAPEDVKVNICHYTVEVHQY